MVVDTARQPVRITENKDREEGKQMKVKTGLNAGSLLSDATNQTKQAVSSTVDYLRDTRDSVIDFASSELGKVRSAWQTLATL
ncbi:MAG: hypothetical protein H6Q37_2463 [Chloroflexi bacterium]|jgi:hypothetical protein|nr:hypothetical protein [Chloroflexota bacterium]